MTVRSMAGPGGVLLRAVLLCLTLPVLAAAPPDEPLPPAHLADALRHVGIYRRADGAAAMVRWAGPDLLSVEVAAADVVCEDVFPSVRSDRLAPGGLVQPIAITAGTLLITHSDQCPGLAGSYAFVDRPPGWRWAGTAAVREDGGQAMQLLCANAIPIDRLAAGADFSGQVLCGFETLTDTDLRGIRLDWAILVGVHLRDFVLDGASLRNAVVIASNFQGSSLRGADLRGAYFPNPSLTEGEPAALDGLTMPWAEELPAWLAASRLPDDARVRLLPREGSDGNAAEFTGAELRAAARETTVADAQERTLDCWTNFARAACTDSTLGMLHTAITMLWQARPRDAQEQQEQQEHRAWTMQRDACGVVLGCRLEAFHERLRALAPDYDAAASVPAPARYEAEPLPPDAASTRGRLARTAGRYDDYMEVVAWLPHHVRLSAFAIGANAHFCSIEPHWDDIRRYGALVIAPAVDLGADPNDPPDAPGWRELELVILPHAIFLLTADRDFCGNRAGWSSVYYRVPASAPHPRPDRGFLETWLWAR
jgi:uncharacterized protein YjbI with pentapeptide repeats